ncbi:hypothetical protein [Viscerimonas tarda]
MNSIRSLTFTLLAILVCISMQAQDGASAKLSGFVKNINSFNYLNPQEKVYLHFDNSGY